MIQVETWNIGMIQAEAWKLAVICMILSAIIGVLVLAFQGTKIKGRLRRLHSRLMPKYAWVLEGILLIGIGFYAGYLLGHGIGQGYTFRFM